jgi:hypothetical protein
LVGTDGPANGIVMYCHQIKIGDLWIITSTFYLKFEENNGKNMATHILGLFFFPADGQAKSAQQLETTLLLFHPLYFSCR